MSKPVPRIVPTTPALARARTIHVGGILVLPLLTTVLALVLALNGLFEAWYLLVFFVMWLISGIGITVGYHRLLTHRAFSATPTARAVLAIMGGIAQQGPPIYWVALHRRHHELADAQGDPHSPFTHDLDDEGPWTGFLHSHLRWMFVHDVPNTLVYAPDLIRDKAIARVNRAYGPIVLASVLLPGLIGLLFQPDPLGFAMGVLWGAGVRLFVQQHAIWSINSACHMFGRRAFQTDDHSTNLAWLALPTLGESWHNNHHAVPNSAAFSTAWHQLDPGWYVVRLLGLLKQASGFERGVARLRQKASQHP